MKVVHVVKQFWPSVGGIEDATLNLALQQKEHQGIDAHIVTLDRTFADRTTKLPQDDLFKNLPIRRISWNGSNRYPLAPSVLEEVKNFDLVHVHGIDFFFDFLALTKILHGRPMVASTHGGFFHTDFAARTKKIYFSTVTRLSAKAYCAIVGCSQADSEMFKKLNLNNLVTIENGVNVNKFFNSSSEKYTRNIIYFGRIASHKRIFSLITLLANLKKINSEWRLTIAGVNADRNMEQLIDFSKENQLEDSVNFSSNPDESALRVLISQATYFACASLHEGFGLAVIEALSAGLIPLLSPIPTFLDFVEQSSVGLIFDPDSPEGAAQEIHNKESSILQNHSLLRKQAVESTIKYSWKFSASKYKDVYKKATRDASEIEY